MDRNELLGLHSGIADVIIDGARVGEFIFDIEIIINLRGKIEAQGVIDEITDGNIDFKGKEVVFTLSGIISREHAAYTTEFSCEISPASYPRFIVKNIDELFANLNEIEDIGEVEEEKEA